MKRRNTILITIAITSLAVILSLAFAGMKEAPKRKIITEQKLKIPVIKVENKDIHLRVPVVGKLIAKDKIEIYSEVSGVMMHTNKDLLEGIHYKKGELMVSINSQESEQSLKSRKSDLMNIISKTLPDLKFDYPESYKQWLAYLNDFDVEKTLQDLPTPIDSREKFYISAKGIYKSFYEIESQETRLAKYKMYAPFDGVITSCSIKPGTLVRAGQKLGSYVKDAEYELAISLSIKETSLINVGDKVNLKTEAFNNDFTGNISRINSSIDSKTQTVMAYVAVSSKLLKEGMFMHAEIHTQTSIRGFSINRKLVQEGNIVFVVENNIIKEKKLNIVQEKSDIIIVEGLTEGTLLSTKTKDIHSGLEVKVSL
jgi:multidrug efflux pump subunit AcrA (membrane-fusion protein)